MSAQNIFFPWSWLLNLNNMMFQSLGFSFNVIYCQVDWKTIGEECGTIPWSVNREESVAGHQVLAAGHFLRRKAAGEESRFRSQGCWVVLDRSWGQRGAPGQLLCQPRSVAFGRIQALCAALMCAGSLNHVGVTSALHWVVQAILCTIWWFCVTSLLCWKASYNYYFLFINCTFLL